jgi:hypothetical protein
MTRQHAEVALRSRDLHFVDLLAHDEPVGGDDLEVEVCR